MTLQLLHSEFPHIWVKFDFLFCQCAHIPVPVRRWPGLQIFRIPLHCRWQNHYPMARSDSPRRHYIYYLAVSVANPWHFWCGSGSGCADPCLWLMDPDPDPGGPKTCGSGGSGSATLLAVHCTCCWSVFFFQGWDAESWDSTLRSQGKTRHIYINLSFFKPFHKFGITVLFNLPVMKLVNLVKASVYLFHRFTVQDSRQTSINKYCCESKKYLYEVCWVYSTWSSYQQG